MSQIVGESRHVLGSAEMVTINECFKQWVKRRDISTRVAKRVLIKEVKEFTEFIQRKYELKEIGCATSLDLSVSEVSTDNLLIDMCSDGMVWYCDYLRSYVVDHEANRIYLPKMLKDIEVFVRITISDAICGIAEDRLAVSTRFGIYKDVKPVLYKY